MPENVQMRERIIAALGAWGESLEAKVKEQLGNVRLPEKLSPQQTDPIVRQMMIEFVTAFGAFAIILIEGAPTAVNYPVWAETMVKTVFDKMLTEEKFTEVAVKKIVDVDLYTRNLVANPQVSATAKEWGLTPEAAARPLAESLAEQTTQAIRSIAPLIIKVAQEPWSMAAVEEQLALAVAKDGGADSGRKKKWWQVRK
jgi:hypothetical protein